MVFALYAVAVDAIENFVFKGIIPKCRSHRWVVHKATRLHSKSKMKGQQVFRLYRRLNHVDISSTNND